MSLRSLGGDVPPPERLKSLVLQDLRARGVLRPRGPRWLSLAAVLAGLGLFAGGYLVGRREGEPAAVAPGTPQYALLLYEDDAFDRTRPEASLVAEYSAWAGRLAVAGQFVGGEKLGLHVAVEPGPGAAGLGDLTGFFIVAAPTDSAARAVARGSPHVRLGGRIVVRRVDPT